MYFIAPDQQPDPVPALDVLNQLRGCGLFLTSLADFLVDASPQEIALLDRVLAERNSAPEDQRLEVLRQFLEAAQPAAKLHIFPGNS